MPNTARTPSIDLQEISTRNEHARHIVAGFASAMPTLADMLGIPARRAQRHGRALRGNHAAFRRTRGHAA